MEDAVRTEITREIADNIENALRQAAEELPEKDRDRAFFLLREDEPSEKKKSSLKGHMLRWAIRETAKEWLEGKDVPQDDPKRILENAMKDEELGRQMTAALNMALDRFPGTIEMQKNLRELFLQWLSQAKQHYPVELDGLNKITLDSEDAKVVQLVKELHGPDGLGQKRTDLQNTLNMSEKTLRNYLDRLSGKDEDHPLRLGGQIVSAPVAIRENENREKYTYTPDALHPIILQLNMTQVAYLLKSLCIASDTGFYGHEITEDLAYGVWSQLTTYAQNRVEGVFAGEHRATRFISDEPSEQEAAQAQAFAAFLKRMKDREEQWISEFVTESENLARFDGSVNPMFAFKSGCGLSGTWQITCKDVVYGNCRFCNDLRAHMPAIRVVQDSAYQRLRKKLFPGEGSGELDHEKERKMAEHICRKQLGKTVLLADILKILPDRR